MRAVAASLKQSLAGLSPRQLSIVVAVFWFTAIGAALLVWWFTRPARAGATRPVIPAGVADIRP